MPLHPLAVAREEAITFGHIIRPDRKHDDEVRLSHVRHAEYLSLVRWVQQRAATAGEKAYRSYRPQARRCPAGDSRDSTAESQTYRITAPRGAKSLNPVRLAAGGHRRACGWRSPARRRGHRRECCDDRNEAGSKQRCWPLLSARSEAPVRLPDPGREPSTLPAPRRVG